VNQNAKERIKVTEEQYENLAKILFDSAYAMYSLSLKTVNVEIFNDLNEPEIGDYVFETTNPFVPKLRAIGKLLEKSSENFGTYMIECLDGKIHTWENAKFVKVADENTKSLIKL